MLRIKEIQEKLINLVGWQQSYNPELAIDEKLTTSESGLFFQSAHPLLTIDNIAHAAMPNDFGFQYKAWNMIQSYTIGTKVRHAGSVWIAEADNVNSEPQESDFSDDFNDDFSTSDWKKYNMLSDYILVETNNAIANAINRFITEKTLDKKSKLLLENKTFFQGLGRLQNNIQNVGKLVGFEIRQKRGIGLTMKVNRIGLQFKGGPGVVPIYLFHSSKTEFIKKINLNYTNTIGSFQWFDVDLSLPYNATTQDGYWYIAYNQSEIPEYMEAISVEKDWSSEPCGTCNAGSIHDWRAMTKYISVSPFFNYNEDSEMWDINRNSYTNSLSYGLNVDFSIQCDLSDFIMSQRSIFARVVQMQVAYNLLRTMAMNPDVKVTRHSTNVTRLEILYELDGQSEGRPIGLSHEMNKAYKALDLDTTGLDNECLSCGNDNKIRYRSV